MAGLSYPLARTAPGEVVTASGTLVSEVVLDRVLAGEIGPDDVRISPDTLRLQADFAEQGGNPQLAANLRRGAELVSFSDEELLAFYDRLRPGRSTADGLDELAESLEARGAVGCASLVREARGAYARRGLVA